MDYFDDENQPGTTNQSETPKQAKKTRWPLFMASGVIIGIIIVVLALPSLMKLNVFPEEWRISGESEEQQTFDEDSESLKGLQDVNVDVSTQITDIVKDVSPAVVGVNNIQRESDFWNQEEDGELYTGSGVIYKKDGG